MTEQQTPTPIDPADIRPGDVVERRAPTPKPDRFTIRRTAPDGCLVDERGKHLIPEGWTWHLVHRPDPDAEVIEALARRMHDDSACKDRFGSCVSTTATYRSEAARYVAYIREQGFDVVKRSDQ